MNINPLKEKYIIDTRYRIDKLISQGGSSLVYLCYDLKLHKKWLLKQFCSLMDNEVTAYRRLSSPSFPRVVDIITDDEYSYIIMDYIEGITLKELVATDNWSEKELTSIFIKIASAISYLHNMSPALLYMDCKPENIIITPDKNAVIVDFGSIYECDSDKSQRISGTPAYASPEQKLASAIDCRSDIYALGKTMYYCMTKTETEYRDSKGRLHPEYKRPDISTSLCNILNRCMQPVAENRYQNMDELIKDLETPIKHSTRLIRRLLYHLKLIGETILMLTAIISYIEYSETMDYTYILLSTCLILTALLLMRREKPVAIQTLKDVYKGTGNHLLIGVIIATLIFSHNFIKTHYINEDNYNISIISAQGYEVLYKGQKLIKNGDDYLISIPNSSITPGNEPQRVILTSKPCY